MKRVLCFAALSLAAVLVILSLAPHRAARAADDLLRVALPAEPTSMNPLFSQNEADGTIATLVFSGLLRRDAHGALAPDLATAVPSQHNREISADGRTITFHLRQGVRWQDGAPFDASDVLFTYDAIRDPKLNIAAALENLTSVIAPNPWTVVFTFRKAEADELGDYFGEPCILPRHLLLHVADLNRADFNTHPVGTGPYAFDEWQRGSSIDLRRNPYYFGARPSIARVRLMFVATTSGIMMLKTGELDSTVVEAGGVSLLRGSSVRIESFRRQSLQFVTLNTKRAPLDDIRVRQALALAIDRPRLVQTVYHGNAVSADGLVPPYDWGYTPLHSENFNITRAQELLDEAGWRAGSGGVRERDGRPLSINMIYYTEQAVLGTLAVQLQAAWAAIGVHVELHPMPVAAYIARSGPLLTGHYEAVLEATAFGSDSPDRSILLDPRLPLHMDDANYGDADVLRWNDAAEATYDRARRKALYSLVDRRVARDVPYIPIAWADTIVGYNDRLERVVIPSVGAVYGFVNDWSFKGSTPR